MHTLAKRVHNVAPRDVRLTFAGGSTVAPEMRSAEFFQEAFQAEGVADDTASRLVTDGADDPLVEARETTDGWTVVGEVVDVQSAALQRPDGDRADSDERNGDRGDSLRGDGLRGDGLRGDGPNDGDYDVGATDA